MERDIELNYKNGDELDIQVIGGDLKVAASLPNRIIVSLFTWAAPAVSDTVPDGVSPGGYWGDNVVSDDSETPGTFGSRIWELSGKITDDTPSLVESYSREALSWLADVSDVAEFAVSAARVGISQIDLTVTITMANGQIQRLVYADIFNWGK